MASISAFDRIISYEDQRKLYSSENSTGATLSCESDSESDLSAACCFPLFLKLGDDLVLNILSFVSEAPVYNRDHTSTLTHILPFVSQKFRSFCQSSELLWSEALARRIKSDPDLWAGGLRAVANGAQDGTDAYDAAAKDVEFRDTKLNVMHSRNILSNETHLMKQARASVMKHESDQTHASANEGLLTVATSQLLYRQIFQHHVRYSGPVLFMPAEVSVGRKFAVHIFEPQHRLVIAQVMANRPRSDLNGCPLGRSLSKDAGAEHGPASLPRFIHANHAPLAPGSPAVIVEVQQCRMFPDVTANVVLMPIAHVWLENLTVRPAYGGLCDGRVVRMGKEHSLAMELKIAPARRSPLELHQRRTEATRLNSRTSASPASPEISQNSQSDGVASAVVTATTSSYRSGCSQFDQETKTKETKKEKNREKTQHTRFGKMLKCLGVNRNGR